MMKSKTKADQDAELLKDFVKAIQKRGKQLCGEDAEVYSFTVGYLESFMRDFVTPEMRRSIRFRMGTYSKGNV